jgi:hypothetical protein
VARAGHRAYDALDRVAKGQPWAADDHRIRVAEAEEHARPRVAEGTDAEGVTLSGDDDEAARSRRGR